MQVTTIIPLHNIVKQRRIPLLINSLYSLSLQTVPIKVVIVDSSETIQAARIETAIEDFGDLCEYIHISADQFNMPRLFNTGIRHAQTEYIHAIGNDFLLKPDYYEVMLKHADPDCFLITASSRLDSRQTKGLNRDKIRQWNIPPAPTSPHGKAACGLQFFHRTFPERFGGYDERFAGWSGMDEEYMHRAESNGIMPEWITETQSVHQWHTAWKSHGYNMPQRRKNWELLKQIKEK